MDMELKPQNWLLVAHAFNMNGVASSQTVTDKLPFLDAAGVRLVALTAPTGRRDPAHEHHQVFSPLPSGLRYEWRHWLRQRTTTHGKLYSRIALALLLPFYLLEKLLLPFGSHWSWWISAYLRGRKLIEQQRPALIYSSGGANSAHYAAYRLASHYGLPWLAEIHDPMIHGGWKKGPFQYRWAAHVEKLICRRADAAIWFTAGALARARARHPELGVRGHVIAPGANPPARNKLPYVRGQKFVLTHFGTLADNRNLASTLDAIALVLTAQPQWRTQVVLRTYGSGWDAVSRAALARFAYPECVEDLGRVERDRALQLMDTTDALLLLHGEDGFCEEYIPSKLYEYFWSQRPILGLVYRNPDLDTLLRAQGHEPAPALDPPAIAAALTRLMQRWLADELQDNGRVSPYSTQRAVTQMLELAQAAIQARA